MRRVRELMGQERLIRGPEDSLAKWENLEAELLPLVRALGNIPSWQQLGLINRGDLQAGIRQHGGMNAVRKRLGLELLKRGAEDSFKTWANSKKALRQITEKLGHFPTETELLGMDMGSLLVALRTYHGGLTGARAKFEGKPLPKKKRHKIVLDDAQIKSFNSAKRGNQAAKIRIIESYMPAIRAEAGKYRRADLWDDLQQAARLGILEKLKKSKTPDDFYYGMQTFIKHKVGEEFKKSHGWHETKKTRAKELFLYQRNEWLSRKLGRTPTLDELAEHTGLPIWEIEEVIAMRRSKAKLPEER
jgi:hypothetical protein